MTDYIAQIFRDACSGFWDSLENRVRLYTRKLIKDILNKVKCQWGIELSDFIEPRCNFEIIVGNTETNITVTMNGAYE